MQDEALTVLEQIMRGQVRADQVDDVRRSVPARVSVNLRGPGRSGDRPGHRPHCPQ